MVPPRMCPSGRPTTQVFAASTAFGLATAVAALDDGAFAVADRRILLLTHNAAVPETASRIEETTGIDVLLSRFDAVYDYNAAIAPQHPSLWSPRAADLSILERYLSDRWSLAGDVHLVLESLAVSPAATVARIFPDARIDVYADGLMSYGPTRTGLPALVASRVERLLHLDLIPGLVPVLLSEHGVRPQLISTAAFLSVVDSLGPSPDVLGHGNGQVAVLLGQYLSAAGVLSVEEEAALQLQMVQGAVAAGCRDLVFKPHPTAPPVLVEPLVAEAARLGASLRVHQGPELVETLFRSPSMGCVIGCFSTALLTAATCYGLPVARVGTELLLERLTPYQNSNRIPVTLVDAAVPHVRSLVGSAERPTAPLSGGVEELQRLLAAVSYCMQPKRYPELRAVAEQLLLDPDVNVGRYVKRRRLSRLELPGGLPDSASGPAASRRLHATARRLLGTTMSDRVSRLVKGVR